MLLFDRYLSDKPCIEVPGRRGFMSRSAFEQVRLRGRRACTRLGQSGAYMGGRRGAL